jgi:uncharacterized protein YjdB
VGLLVLGLVGIIGSGGDDITGPGNVTLTSITVTPSAVPDGLPVGLTQQFTAIAEYSNATQQDVTSSVNWSSSNTAAATIGVNTGLATGVADGSTDITASLSGITSNIVNLAVVTLTLNRIEISPAVMPDDLPLGISQQFTAIGTFSNYRSYDITRFVTWNSDNPVAASITSSGLLTGASVDSTNITASTITPMRISNNVNLDIVNKTAVDLIVEPQWVGSLPINRMHQMKALLLFSDDSTFDVTSRVSWSSNNNTVAAVNNDVLKGLVTAYASGRVTITALDSTLGLSNTATIDVNNATIVSVSISPGTVSNLPAGFSQEFTATGLFSDGLTRRLNNPLSWSVNGSSLATIDEAGAVTRIRGIAPGNVNLTYTDILANGVETGQVGAASLVVTDAVLQSISIVPSSAFTLPTNSTQVFTAEGTFAGNLLRDVTNDVIWDSSSTAVAVFGPDKGSLTASAAGTSSVTAQRSALVTSASVTVTVQDAVADSLTITPQTGAVNTVNVGQTKQFIATATFPGGITADYTERVYWQVSATSDDIATVSTAAGTKGQVTGIRAGSVTLDATVPGTGLTASSLTVTVQ